MPKKEKTKDEEHKLEKKEDPPKTMSPSWLLDYHMLIDSKRTMQLMLKYKEPTAKKPQKDDERLELTLSTSFGLRKPTLPYSLSMTSLGLKVRYTTY